MAERKTPKRAEPTEKVRETKAVVPRKSELQTAKEELDRLMSDDGPVSQGKGNRVAELKLLIRKLERT